MCELFAHNSLFWKTWPEEGALNQNWEAQGATEQIPTTSSGRSVLVRAVPGTFKTKTKGEKIVRISKALK